MMRKGSAPQQEFSHVRFYDTSWDLGEAVRTLVKPGDYIHCSYKGAPLWAHVVEGVVVQVAKYGLYLDERETATLTKKDTKVTITSWNRNQYFAFGEFRGFRVDQSIVWTSKPGSVKKYRLTIGGGTRPGFSPREIKVRDPVKGILSDLHPGDYLTVWSREDDKVKDFLHYPVQGWVDMVQGETATYIHPPRMERQVWRFRDNPGCQHTMGVYRKLVLQLHTDPGSVTVPPCPSSTKKKVRTS